MGTTLQQLFYRGRNYNRLISIELHHIAGDMMHIAKMAEEENYYDKVISAMKHEFKNQWAEEKTKYLSDTNILLSLQSKIPEMPEGYDSMGDACKGFLEMIGIFKDWDEIKRTKGSYCDLKTFYWEIKRKCRLPDDLRVGYSHESYDKLSLIKYRLQRKLSLYPHPKYFNIYDSDAGKKVQKSSWDRIIKNYSYNTPSKAPVTTNKEEHLRSMQELYTIDRRDPPHVFERKKRERPGGIYYDDCNASYWSGR